MSMTRKDFAGIAAVIADIRTSGVPFINHLSTAEVLLDVERGLADLCSNSNPHFDRVRFIRACQGVTVNDHGREI